MDSGSGLKPTGLFADLATAQAFNLSPIQWAQLTRIDKKILHYQRAMQAFYDDAARRQAQMKATEANLTRPKLRR